MAVADIRPARGEEHPGDLLDRAVELDREADDLRAEADRLKTRAKEREAQAAALRHKAQRLLHPELGVTVKQSRPKPPDALLGAAALAVEDLEGTILPTQLAEILKIGSKRAGDLLDALLEAEKVERNNHGGYRAIDPEIGRARDAVIELGEFSEAQFADRMGMPRESARWYLLHLKQRGVVEKLNEATWAYVVPGAERVVTRRPRRPTPEEELRRDDIKRGETVPYTGKPMVESPGAQRHAAERRRRGGKTRKQKK